MTSNDPKERSLGRTYIWIIEIDLAQDNLELVTMIPLALSDKSFWTFCHSLIMVRSQNWPDLRAPKSKFRDKFYVGTDAAINSWKLHVDP